MEWLRQNGVALFSLCVSGLALLLSYRRFRLDTLPAIVLRRSPQVIEIENVGTVVAVGIKLSLLERVKRPSAKLQTAGTLRPGDKAEVTAYGWPEALESEVSIFSCDAIIHKIGGRKLRPGGKAVAFHLLTREGRGIIVLRFRVGDGAKTNVRFFFCRQPEAMAEMLNWRPVASSLETAFAPKCWKNG